MFLAVRDHIAEAYGDFTTRASSNRLGLTARQLRHALEYIEANLSQDVSLADVANASATSVSSLTRGFKTALGISPHRWVLNRRIALAQRLIYESATPLNEVAATCGFADQSHLTRVFMRNIGSSPAVWRRRKQTEQDAGVLCSKGEEGGEPDACATTLPRNDAPIQRAGNDGSDVNGSDCEIACEADRRSVRQSNKISGFKPNGFVDPSTESQQWPETSAKHKKQLLRSNWKDQSPPASIPPDM
jgi:AraC-like DNA-binding protein